MTRATYLDGPKVKLGRKRVLTYFEIAFLINLIASNEFTRLSDLILAFREQYYVNEADSPSHSTIRRLFKRRHFVRLVMERRHMCRDVVKRALFLRRVQHVPIQYLVDMDEMAASPDHFLEMKGWGLKGRRLIKRQIKIGTRHFSVIAAYGLYGFICWTIIEGSYGGADFIDFLRKLRPYLIKRQMLSWS